MKRGYARRAKSPSSGTLGVQKILEELRNDVHDARLHFEVYRIYKESGTRQKYWPAIIRFEKFFATSLRAQFVATFAALGRVFDKDERNVSIATLFKADPSYEQIVPASLSRAKQLWSQKAKTLRHEVVAHHATAPSPGEAFKRAAISLDNIEELISVCEGLLDAWTKRAGCHVHFLSSSKLDTIALLESLLPKDE
jgi:hypothetical protein